MARLIAILIIAAAQTVAEIEAITWEDSTP